MDSFYSLFGPHPETWILFIHAGGVIQVKIRTTDKKNNVSNQCIQGIMRRQDFDKIIVA